MCCHKLISRDFVGESKSCPAVVQVACQGVTEDEVHEMRKVGGLLQHFSPFPSNSTVQTHRPPMPASERAW